MSYNFTQVINRLNNGKCLTRPSWSSGKYITTIAHVDGILIIFPNNPNNPASLYYATLSDFNATDWVDVN